MTANVILTYYGAAGRKKQDRPATTALNGTAPWFHYLLVRPEPRSSVAEIHQISDLWTEAPRNPPEVSIPQVRKENVSRVKGSTPQRLVTFDGDYLPYLRVCGRYSVVSLTCLKAASVRTAGQ